MQQLLPGENAKDYHQLLSRVFAEAGPKTAIESMLVDQIVGDMWRLKRVEQAEHAYFEQVQMSSLVRTLRSLTAKEIRLLPNILKSSEQDCAVNTIGPLRKADLSDRSPSKINASRDTEKETPSNPEPTDPVVGAVRQKLVAAADPEKLMLDAMVSPYVDCPYGALERIRRSLVRGVLRKDANLAERQYRRPIAMPGSI